METYTFECPACGEVHHRVRALPAHDAERPFRLECPATAIPLRPRAGGEERVEMEIVPAKPAPEPRFRGGRQAAG